ncbi:MAG: ATP-binding protein [Desulfobacterales bacterium]|nr:ATP-binding protein [Desulfobacterales bacterium]
MEKETSCINSWVILDYFKKHNDGDISLLLNDLHPEIDCLPDPEGFLKDPNNWISCKVISKLFQRAITHLNDPMSPYRIARHAVETASLGYVLRIFIKGFWSYQTGLKHIQKINDKWNRSKKVELVQAQKNEAVIRLHWAPHMQVTKPICLYNQGAYTFMPLIWDGVPLRLEENCCYFEGAPYCEYNLKWPQRNRLLEIYSRFFTSRTVLKDAIREMEQDKRTIELKYEEVNRLNKELNQKIKQLLAIQETGRAILSVLDIKELLSDIMNIIYNVCRINRAIVMLVDEEGNYLEYIHGVGFGDDVREVLRGYKVPLTRVSNIVVRVARTGQPEYVHDVENSSLRKENIIIAHGKPTSAFVVPLITRSKVIGVIATDAVDATGIPEETRETMKIFASQIAIAIENARLYSRLQNQMEELKRSQALLSRAEKFSFLGNLAARLAHEIKNPMTAIGTFIQMLPKKYDDEEFRKGFYEIASEETRRVNNLITELLDLVKTRETNFELGDLHALIDKMILLVSPQSNSKKIQILRQFSPDIPPVWMDTEKMKETVLNILSNAIDFSYENGTIQIATRQFFTRRNSADIQIEITDNGPGIPAGVINEIFDPYFTTKHKSTIHSGTGLGLFIAHQNIVDHGGIIEVNSKPDEGAAFIMTLPLKPSSVDTASGKDA